MRIGLLSDTQGDLALTARCAAFLVAQCGAERIFFLGNCFSDLDHALREMEREGLPQPAVARVPAKEDPEYADGPVKDIEMLGSLLCCLIHDKSELTKDDIGNVSLIFHGKTPEGAMVQIGKRFFITPGTLDAPGGQGTFGLLALGPNALQFVIYGSRDLSERRRDTARLDRRTNFKAG